MKVIITIGDPAGCGPLITCEAIYRLRKKDVDFFVVADEKILKRVSFYKKIKDRINLIDLNTPKIEKIKEGYPSKLGGKASLEYLKKALEIMKNKNITRLVTAPLSKEAVKLNFPSFCGHTEYLADRFKVKNFAMMMVSKKMKVVLFSRHIPLREVVIKEKEYLATLKLVYSSLRSLFGIKKPKICIASFNPHAGIDTFLDREEKAILKVIKRLKNKVYGPYPSDTIFIKENFKKYHCIVASYHDQGMIPFKMVSLKEGVNLTLGLPIIRTSPAHGVAYEAVKKRKVFSSSMIEAIKLALKLKI
jgi:4-hydroxythreonine-4-phosphate dehydrogenase